MTIFLKGMMLHKFPIFLVFCLSFVSTFVYSNELDEAEQLGKELFFDTRLSEPEGQSCSSCHSPEFAFTDPDKTKPTSNGVINSLFGSRNSPTLMYLATVQSRVNIVEAGMETFSGGFFLDGRASSLEEQVEGPLLSPVEMANSSKMDIVKKVRSLGYSSKFDEVFGSKSLYDDRRAFSFIAAALASYERSREFNPFTSKYDLWLAGKTKLSELEKQGLDVYEDEKKGNCAACHPNRAINGEPPLFTDFTYDNLGVPFNKKNPFLNNPKQFNKYGSHFIDRGLGLQDSLRDIHHYGKFKVPTLRNVALTSPYMHNGVFDTLEEVVEFYSTRDTDDKWGKPEVSSTVNMRELGDLKLKESDLEALVAFLKTLTDGYE